jgi:transposase-like protein
MSGLVPATFGMTSISHSDSRSKKSAKRDVLAAKRFFKKMMRADHRRLPFTISADKNAAYPETFTTSQIENVLPKDCK